MEPPDHVAGWLTMSEDALNFGNNGTRSIRACRRRCRVRRGVIASRRQENLSPDPQFVSICSVRFRSGTHIKSTCSKRRRNRFFVAFVVMVHRNDCREIVRIGTDVNAVAPVNLISSASGNARALKAVGDHRPNLPPGSTPPAERHRRRHRGSGVGPAEAATRTQTPLRPALTYRIVS